MTESDRVSHLVCVFTYYIKREDLTECQRVLKKLVQFRKFQVSENYNYMKKLLDHLMFNSPIYFRTINDFKAIPILYHEISVIHALEEGSREIAQEHWNNLKEIAPLVYREKFDYQGQKSLFGLCLQKYSNKKIISFPIDRNSKLKALLFILNNASGPIRKGELFELLWGEVPESKEDLKPLINLVHLLRKDLGIKIISRKGSYFIEKEAKSKISTNASMKHGL